jgi:glutaredoxin
MIFPEIVVYTKPDCCLCDKLKGQLQKLQASHQFAWREINILEDSAAFKKFQHEIPVVFVGGQMASRYKLDEKRFVHLLETAGTEPSAGTESAP